jgi:hypothetical protein
MEKNNRYQKLLEEQKKAAKSALGNLDYLDSLPSAPPRAGMPFPYGSTKARPYGWSSATLRSVENEKNAC